MSCNSCAKPYTLLRKEKSCPACGFSYCSKCLDNKMFVSKLKAEVKVCAKCKNTESTNEKKKIEPPDAYYKRLELNKNDSISQPDFSKKVVDADVEISNRLKKLKADEKPKDSDEIISQRLQKIKEVPTVSDTELQERLARLRGVPVASVQTQPVLIKPDLRTEHEQAEDLLKQYIEQTSVDAKYQDEFDSLVNDMESRLGTLKGASTSGQSSKSIEYEEETVKTIIEKAKAAALLEEQEFSSNVNDELPFCEICNEDAKMRCLGCKYLFCKRCFIEHKDEDDGCDRYEPYSAPKGPQH